MLRAALSFLIVGFVLAAVPRATDGFYAPVHTCITTESLPFLRSKILEEVVDGDVGRDNLKCIWRKADRWHFNDCDFLGSSQTIRQTEDKIAAAFATPINQGNAERMAWHFGTVLHAVQDFYSHSNWVELQQPGGGKCATDDSLQPDLVDSKYGKWPLMKPWTQIGSVVIVQGDTESEAFKEQFPIGKLRWCPGVKKAVVDVDAQHKLKAVVTGQVRYLYGYWLFLCKKCPAEIGALHWDRWNDGKPNEVHKDGPEQRPYHRRAVELATRQTVHE